MSIESIVANSGTGAPATPTTNPKQTMNGEMFLQLLVTQLRAQDPSSPMDTSQMMTQTTQLATMEQMTTQTKVSQENFALQMRMAAAGMVGKNVTYTGADGQPHTGLATAVSFATDVPTVTIDGTSVRLDAVSGVASVSS